MTVAALLGATFGLAAYGAWRAIRPAPPPLRLLLDRLDRHAPLTAINIEEGGWVDGVSRWLGARLLGVADTFDTGPRTAADLRLVGRSREQHTGSRILLAVTGLLLPLAASTAVGLAGLSLPPALAGAAALVLAAAGAVTPDLLLADDARRMRAEFTRGLGSFLDLVVISLAGGAGVEGALHEAADGTGGWPAARLRGALAATRATGETVWAGLGRLGEELAVTDLSELAASLALAGTEGARVRHSLVAKAAAIRARQLAEAEAYANAATERLALPGVLLFTGFLILVGYPALSALFAL